MKFFNRAKRLTAAAVTSVMLVAGLPAAAQADDESASLLDDTSTSAVVEDPVEPEAPVEPAAPAEPEVSGGGGGLRDGAPC